jgi:hypothetical protein
MLPSERTGSLQGQEYPGGERSPVLSSGYLNVGCITWLLGTGLLLGLLSILLWTWEVHYSCVDNRLPCGLGEPCSPARWLPPLPACPDPHPFALIGIILLSCAVACLLLALVAFRRRRQGKMGWLGEWD